jgi:hypothetical protein
MDLGVVDLLAKFFDGYDPTQINANQSPSGVGGRDVDAKPSAVVDQTLSPNTGQFGIDCSKCKPGRNAAPGGNRQNRSFDLGVMLKKIPTPVWALIAAFGIWYLFLR